MCLTIFVVLVSKNVMKFKSTYSTHTNTDFFSTVFSLPKCNIIAMDNRKEAVQRKVTGHLKLEN